MNNQHFDDFLKNKANERSFQFDESYWNEMEQLIDDQGNDKPSVRTA